MKKMTIITLALALLVTTSMPNEAGAGWFDKKDKKVEKYNAAHRFDLFPSMAFFSGTIQRDSYAGWQLDDLGLQMAGNATVTMEGSEDAFLQEGRSAIVMGVKYGTTLVAYRVRIMKSFEDYSNLSHGERVEPGDDPDVGIMTGPM